MAATSASSASAARSTAASAAEASVSQDETASRNSASRWVDQSDFAIPRLAVADGELDPHRRPLAWRAEHAQCAAEGLHPVGEPDQPGAPGGIGAPEAIVPDRD